MERYWEISHTYTTDDLYNTIILGPSSDRPRDEINSFGYLHRYDNYYVCDITHSAFQEGGDNYYITLMVKDYILKEKIKTFLDE